MRCVSSDHLFRVGGRPRNRWPPRGVLGAGLVLQLGRHPTSTPRESPPRLPVAAPAFAAAIRPPRPGAWLKTWLKKKFSHELASMADAPAPGAPSPGAPAQGHDDDSARPLSLPALNLLASFRVRQDEDNGEVAARPSLPAQRQVTKHIMQTWMLHEQMHRNPPTDRMRDVHMLHHTQSVTMLDETSALHGNMPQHNDEEGGKQPRLSFLPCSVSVGTDGPCMDDRRPKCAAHHGVNHREGLSCLLPSIFRKKFRVAKVPGTMKRGCSSMRGPDVQDPAHPAQG